jgi:hypothetical protein
MKLARDLAWLACAAVAVVVAAYGVVLALGVPTKLAPGVAFWIALLPAAGYLWWTRRGR